MRLYHLQEYDTLYDIDGQQLPFEAYSHLKTPNVICSLKLIAKRGDQIQTLDSGETLSKPITQPYAEEVFFKIISYIPVKDRYLVEMIDFFGGGKVWRVDTISYRVEVEGIVNEDIQRRDNEEKVDKLYIERYKGKDDNEIKAIKEQYKLGDINKDDCRRLIRKLRFKREKGLRRELMENGDTLTIGDKINKSVYLSRGGKLISESTWLKPGHKITCKLKNVHYLPLRFNAGLEYLEAYKTFTYKFVTPRFLTTWSGKLLPAHLRDLIQVGNIIRCHLKCKNKANGSMVSCAAVYLRVVSMLESEELIGVLDEIYPLFSDEFIHESMFVFKREMICEIPESFEGNERIQSLVNKEAKTEGLCPTGWQLSDSDNESQ